MAPIGNFGLCFFRSKRSSRAAATISPSTTRAAAASCPCDMRYSRSSRPGQCWRLKGTDVSIPLIPMIFMLFRLHARHGCTAPLSSPFISSGRSTLPFAFSGSASRT